MIYFNMNNSDETKKLFEEEKNFLENRKKSQNNYKNIILQYINNFIDFNSVDIDSTSSVLKFLENLKDCLEFCTTNISKLNTIILDLDKVKLAMQNNDNNIEEMLNNFNKIYLDLNTTIMENTLKIEQCILSIAEKSELKISKTVVETNSVEDKSDIQEKNNSTICETEKMSRPEVHSFRPGLFLTSHLRSVCLSVRLSFYDLADLSALSETYDVYDYWVSVQP